MDMYKCSFSDSNFLVGIIGIFTVISFTGVGILFLLAILVNKLKS